MLNMYEILDNRTDKPEGRFQLSPIGILTEGPPGKMLVQTLQAGDVTIDIDEMRTENSIITVAKETGDIILVPLTPESEILDVMGLSYDEAENAMLWGL